MDHPGRDASADASGGRIPGPRRLEGDSQGRSTDQGRGADLSRASTIPPGRRFLAANQLVDRPTEASARELTMEELLATHSSPREGSRPLVLERGRNGRSISRPRPYARAKRVHPCDPGERPSSTGHFMTASGRHEGCDPFVPRGGERSAYTPTPPTSAPARLRASTPRNTHLVP